MGMKNLEEQARLQEELVQQERALRDTRYRNIHEVEELKRAQEIRIDEFSRHELRESHATIQGAHFTNTGFAGKNQVY